jgi:hypothetical protein
MRALFVFLDGEKLEADTDGIVAGSARVHGDPA